MSEVLDKTFVTVCHDANGPSEWKYCPDEGRYYRFSVRGALMARINGASLPDPMTLWENRCTKRGFATSSAEGKALKPQMATFDLWNHWKENKPS